MVQNALSTQQALGSVPSMENEGDRNILLHVSNAEIQTRLRGLAEGASLGQSSQLLHFPETSGVSQNAGLSVLE